MTDSNATELLCCPFCGGEASKRLFYGTRYGVYCDECDARVGGLFNTEAEAIEAWNTRAGRGECELETDYDYLHDGIPDTPEDTWAYKCSACGDSFRYERGIKPNYCPECGKAVKR